MKTELIVTSYTGGESSAGFTGMEGPLLLLLTIDNLVLVGTIASYLSNLTTVRASADHVGDKENVTYQL